MERRKDSKGRVLKEGESQRKDGTYMFRYSDPSKKRKCVYAKTLNELRAKEAEINKNTALGVYTNEWTMNELFDRYILSKTSNELKDRTKYKYVTEYNRWVRPTWFGNKKIKNITQSDVKLFYKEKSEIDGFSNGTIKCIHKYINGALQMAYEDDIIRRNYATPCIELYKSNAPRKPMTKKQTRMFLDACDNYPHGKKYLLGFKLMLLSGLRVGEMSGLTWDDVDLKKRVIDVNHQFVIGDKDSRTTYHIDAPKTDHGKRKVPISDELFELFTQIKKESYFESYKFGTNVDGYSGFIIHTRTGLPVLTSRFNDYARKVVQEYNETHKEKIPHVSCHICRHTFCTRMAELKISPTALKEIVGHSSYETTENIYIDVDEDFVSEEFYRALKNNNVV